MSIRPLEGGFGRARSTSTKPWFTLLRLPVGGAPKRHLAIPVFSFLVPTNLAPHKRRDSHDRHAVPLSYRLLFPILATLILLALPIVVVALLALLIRSRRSSLVFTHTEIERIWRWEIAQGHYPSRRPPGVPLNGPSTETLGSTSNPGLPSGSRGGGLVLGTGPERKYLSLPVEGAKAGQLAEFPPRPVFGSVLDLDEVMRHCDFSEGKYVRDCLEVLRVNAGLQDSWLRRGKLEAWRTTFVSDGQRGGKRKTRTTPTMNRAILGSVASTFSSYLADLERHTLSLPPSTFSVHSPPHPSHPSADFACDADNPRIFHIFWAGPFSDKPYAAALSFLYSQNLALSSPIGSPPPSSICRPQLWIWINPGPASSLPNSHAHEEMRAELKSNPWSAPLLHPRFEQAVKFQLWNTTEQLDGIKEMKGWRDMQLFNTHGKKFSSPKADPDKPQEKLFSRVGSADSSSYDRLSVVLSDMARFVLTYRFGGIYLDADTLLLRDWEELFGWKGVFGYRWSRLPLYNTAVLKMQRGSAIGSWVFRTAVANGLDFHPMTLSRYTKDAGVDNLILRLPDALFDSPWLNIEGYQRDRPAFPNFKSFDDFFETPKEDEGGAAPVAVGFDGFFRGAFSYHWHNSWWRPFDPVRNFPDLGPRFHASEQAARVALALANPSAASPPVDEPARANSTDLSWSTVMKRTFESFLRGETPNMYGEWIDFSAV